MLDVILAGHLAPLTRRVYDPIIGMAGLGIARARMVAAIFTVAMLYVSVCSTTCAMGACPTEVQHSDGHECDQSSSSRSEGSPHHGSENPDCSVHNHPSVFLEKAAGASQFQLSSTGHVNVYELLVRAPREMAVSLAVLEIAGLGPPVTLKNPLYQQISVLRI